MKAAKKHQLIRFDEFQKETSLKGFLIFSKDRKNLQGIDQALHYFERNSGAMSPYLKLEALLFLIGECNRWLQLKQSKDSSNTQQRREWVQKLKKSAIEVYASEVYEHKKATSQIPAAQLKGLEGGYAKEASRPKGQPRPSASNVKAYMKEQGSPLDFHTMTPAEYAYWEKVTEEEEQKDAQTGHPEMKYLSKLERQKYMIQVMGGKLYRGPFEIYDTMKTFDIWAMDRYGCLYADAGSQDYFHHSTFMRGQDVLCAGEIWVRQGQMTMISNGSGHYCPTRHNLHSACSLLARMGVDFGRVEIVVKEAEGSKTKVSLYPGRIFLQNVNARPAKVEYGG